ncbi:MAG: hypothetical protein SLAVMIC_00131 [uncultured marine phage]|uniref:Uncharacterized protein n=1 Tax=uncultured marine phage TaxID=707152 RepID=A0A8D9FQH6_9VIRU|nr:MAG: hypothetical protein SLAVMIC_00131 [uncultured marine phage]
MDIKYQIFLERKTISESSFLGYLNGTKTVVLERNGKHLFFEEDKLNEYNKEIKTDAGVWRVKSLKNKGEYIDLNDENVDIKTDIKYQFLGLTFTPKFIGAGSKGQYFTTIQPIGNNEKGSDKYPSWVLYANSLEELEKDIRVSAKLYRQEYDLD